MSEALLIPLITAILLGGALGLIGAFLVLRSMAMLGDTVGHAILPGLVTGYIVSGGQKNIPSLFLGAFLSCIGAIILVYLTQKWSKTKSDAAQGIVLTWSYALGVTGLSWVQQGRFHNPAGLNGYLFGQLAVIDQQNLLWTLIFIALALTVIIISFRPLILTSFDPTYAASTGVPTQAVQMSFLVALTLVIIIGSQAVGIILVSALLIIPGAIAQLSAQRLPAFLITATCTGIASGFLGTLWSYYTPNLPPGPALVIIAGLLFALVFQFHPRTGLLPKYLKSLKRQRSIGRENFLKELYKAEDQGGHGWVLERQLPNLARYKNSLLKEGLIETREHHVRLSPKGQKQARQLLRNHRIWETYLSQMLDYPHDHVHREAEDVEHLLTPTEADDLHKTLGNPKTDPHGSVIPSSITEESPH